MDNKLRVAQPSELQVKQKKEEFEMILNETILSQYAYDINSNSAESVKKKQEVAMFLSKLVNTKDTSGRLAIMTCSQESIKDCCITYCNNELNFFRNQAYLFPFGNTLQFIISKDGYVSMAKALDSNIEDFYYDIVYKNDEFEFKKEAGKTIITKHLQRLENITCNIEDIVCAYATCVFKDGTHIADIMTMREITNALKTAHKSLTETHKTNPKIMLSKFPLRRLAKQRINQSANQQIRETIRFEDENIEQPIRETIEVEIDENQEYSEPITIESETPIIEEIEQVWTSEEMENVLDEIEEENEWFEVRYGEWKEKYSLSGEYEMKPKSYNQSTRTCLIRKVKWQQ